MKKILVVLLVLTMLVSMSGLVFAADDNNDNNYVDQLKSGAKINGDMVKSIYFDNEASAVTGQAGAYANNSTTDVNSQYSAEAKDSYSDASNENPKLVTNQGKANACTANSTAANNVKNHDEECITEKAQSNADCWFDISNIPELLEWIGNGNSFCDTCNCCPAEIIGGTDISVQLDNLASAASGDAEASGNVSSTSITSNDSAIAHDGGSASNNNPVNVENCGDASAASGEANATNNAENSVLVNILRSAEANKKLSVCASFAAL